MRTRAYFPVPWNGVKTETFSPQNDRTMELNVNFLLTATVYIFSAQQLPTQCNVNCKLVLRK